MAFIAHGCLAIEQLATAAGSFLCFQGRHLKKCVRAIFAVRIEEKAVTVNKYILT